MYLSWWTKMPSMKYYNIQGQGNTSKVHQAQSIRCK